MHPRDNQSQHDQQESKINPAIICYEAVSLQNR